jgi:hypothetical protein
MRGEYVAGRLLGLTCTCRCPVHPGLWDIEEGFTEDLILEDVRNNRSGCGIVYMARGTRGMVWFTLRRNKGEGVIVLDNVVDAGLGLFITLLNAKVCVRVCGGVCVCVCVCARAGKVSVLKYIKRI